MAGEHGRIVCGEWDTNENSIDASGEAFNIHLPIIRIIRHPDFLPTLGPLNGNDIAVFQVDDTAIQNNVANVLKLWPTCLPSSAVERPETGIHTGWSKPPPRTFIESQAPAFLGVYDDFFKQWHYKNGDYGNL